MAEAASVSQGIARPPPQDGPFVLRKLVSGLPLSADGERTDARITCVEVWGMFMLLCFYTIPYIADCTCIADGNLYVGTSAAEILHFVLEVGDI